MTRLNVAAGIFVYLGLQMFVYGADVIYRHALDLSWPHHARYHLVISGIHIITMSIMTVVVAIGGLRQARRNSWLTLLLVCTLGWAAWPLARLIAGEPPPFWVQMVTGGSLAAAVIALGISYGPCFKKAAPGASAAASAA